jgi:polysaccharide export outer membrane protein
MFSIWLGVSCGVGICAEPKHTEVAAAVAKESPQSGVSSADSARPLSPNDAIAMTVYQEDDLNTKTIIDKNGMVMLPLLGQVKISGLTVLDATKQIQQLYDKDYLVNPRVNLIVEHFAERRFSVLGQVQKPGSYEFPQNESVNLLEAIAIAGGYTRLGSPAKVSVQRVENGSPKIYPQDAGRMAKDPKKKPFEILPDDIINVGERTF